MTKLEKMLKYVSEHNDFYKNRIKEYGIKDPLDITQWPVLTRKELQENRYNMFSDGYKSKYFNQQLRRQASSGSSGIPVNVYWDSKSYFTSMRALWVKRFQHFGIRPNDRQVMFALHGFNTVGDDSKVRYVNSPNNILNFNVSSLYKNSTYEEMIDIIDSFQPVWLYVRPFVLNRLIDELTTKQNISTIIFYVLLLSMTPLLNHVIQLTLGAYSFRLKRELRICFKENLFSYIATMKYESLESPEIAVQTNRICQGEPDAPLEMLDMLINFLSSLINIAFIVSIVSVLNPIVVVVLIAILIINAAVTKKINENNYVFNKEASERNNKLFTYQNDLTNPMNGKEIRLFHAKDFFLKRYICEERKNEAFTQKNHRFIFVQILYFSYFPELHTASYYIREKTKLLSNCCLCSVFVVRIYTENPSQKMSNFDKLLNDSCFF